MKNIFTIAASALLLASCSTPKMALPGQDQFRELPVKGRQGFLLKQRLQFGEFNTTSVKRSWTKGSSSRSGISIGKPGDPNYENLVSMEYSKKKQTVNFSLADDRNNSSEVRCITNFSSDELLVGNNPNSILNIGIDILRGINSSNTFYAQVFVNDGEKPWQLLLDNELANARPGRYRGAVALDKNHYYSIVPVNKMLNKKGEAKKILAGSIGLELRNSSDETVAAVSLMDNGAVYLKTVDEKEKFLLANICAALLLQEQIGD